MRQEYWAQIALFFRKPLLVGLKSMNRVNVRGNDNVLFEVHYHSQRQNLHFLDPEDSLIKYVYVGRFLLA